MIFANPAFIFSESNIQHPMRLFFDFPVAALGFQNQFGVCEETGDEITSLYFYLFADLPARNNADDAF